MPSAVNVVKRTGFPVSPNQEGLQTLMLSSVEGHLAVLWLLASHSIKKTAGKDKRRIFLCGFRVVLDDQKRRSIQTNDAALLPTALIVS